MSHYSKVLIRPVVTEKMTALQESENKYAFEVPEKEKQNR
jgi:large subunit ribosomal protein L23